MDFVDIKQAVNSLTAWEPWVIILIIIVSGGVGGLAQKYSVTIPTENKRIKLPFLNYVVVGIAAALGVMFVLTSDPLLRLVSFSVVAGFGGKAILSAMEERLKATDTQIKARRIAETAEKIVDNVSVIGEGIEKGNISAPTEIELKPKYAAISEEADNLIIQIKNLREGF